MKIQKALRYATKKLDLIEGNRKPGLEGGAARWRSAPCPESAKVSGRGNGFGELAIGIGDGDCYPEISRYCTCQLDMIKTFHICHSKLNKRKYKINS